jgi:stalled ribosome rescue protein Dom34
MTHSHAVVWTDHHSAKVLQFDDDHTAARIIREHTRHTVQHGSAVRTEHEFFVELCDALDTVAQVLVTGSHTALADFRHFVEKHRPAMAARVVAYEPVDHPTENQLVALARKHFALLDRMSGIPTPP